MDKWVPKIISCFFPIYIKLQCIHLASFLYNQKVFVWSKIYYQIHCLSLYRKTYLRNMHVSDGHKGAEDVHISQCFRKAGIKFVFSFGFHAQTMDHENVNLTAKDAVCGTLSFQERRRLSCWWNQTLFVIF